MKILIVDDSLIIRRFISETLKGTWHEIVEAENGDQAVDYCIHNDVDLILMDVEMPGMNGIEATKAIRAYKKNDWFPIIFFSGKTDDDSFITAILSGADIYLPKPINPLRLQLTVVAMERIYEMRKEREELKKIRLDLQKANLELERLALYDKLTGLANRRYFDVTLEQQFSLSNRDQSPLSMIICDIDFFKKYNDSYGHQDGDNCLTIVAEIISSQMLRPTDLACRYGGEEFAIILPNTDLNGALFVAEKMRVAVTERKIEHKESDISDFISLSLGVATHLGQFKTELELIREADKALYQSKEFGRNRVSTYSQQTTD